MNKLIRLSKTGIEYGDYAWNFASGCGNNIDGKCKAGGFRCWAHSITQRFDSHYPNGFKPTIYPEALCSPLYLKKPSRILCVFMGDLFWDCPEFDPWREVILRGKDGRVFFEGSLRDRIMMTTEQCPQHTFLFLTKNPKRLVNWGNFPDNCWVGETITTPEMAHHTNFYLPQVEAKIKFISFEPLLGDVTQYLYFHNLIKSVQWVIIGACTGTKPDLIELNKRYPGLTLMPYGHQWTLQPHIEWVEEIVRACDKAKLPIFLKDNLRPIWYNYLRQEMPVEDDYANCGRDPTRL